MQCCSLSPGVTGSASLELVPGAGSRAGLAVELVTEPRAVSGTEQASDVSQSCHSCRQVRQETAVMTYLRCRELQGKSAPVELCDQKLKCVVVVFLSCLAELQEYLAQVSAVVLEQCGVYSVTDLFSSAFCV